MGSCFKFFQQAVVPDLFATTTIADVTAVGTVSTLTTGVFDTLVEGEFYMFQTALTNAGSNGNAEVYINADSTATNYYRGKITAVTSVEKADANLNSQMGASAGEFCTQQGICGVQNGTPYLCYQEAHGATSRRAVIGAMYNTSETTFTELQITRASSIGDGSSIKIWKLNQTPIVDVSVSGASVTTLSTGAFTALDSTKTYMMITQINAESSQSYANMFINGDTTLANYKRGQLRSGGTMNDTNNTAVHGTVSTSGMSVGYSYIGVQDSIPFINALMVNEHTTSRLQQQSVHNRVETDFTSLDLTSNAASWLKEGTRIRIYELGGV
jgi:hypothetical protein